MKRQKHFFMKYLCVFLILCALFTIKRVYIDIPRASVVSYSYTQNRRELIPYVQCDVAGQYVYFTYQPKRTLIVVYDLNTNYLQTIEFADSENGYANIRSEQDQLFLKLRNHNVFIIRGKEVTATLTEEEADQKGYTDEWFENAPQKAEIRDTSVCVYDGDNCICVFWPSSKGKGISNAIMKFFVFMGVIVLASNLKLYIAKHKSM